MKSKFEIASIVTAIAVLLGMGVLALNTTKDQPSTQATNQSDTAQPKSNSGSKFATLKGDAFDEAFIADMLAHHEGAVNMAEQAQAVTAHEEIRALAGEITRMQSLEMMDMRQWQKDWGYEITNSGGHMSHGGGGMEMAGDMTEMMAKLQGLKGEAYDREFLKQMIIHHEQAVEMAEYADTNAKHEEIKMLASDIITAQEREIGQMKAWQKQWGYTQS